LAILRWHLLTIAHTLWVGGFTVTITTNAASHLYLRYSNIFPRIHRKTVERRGVAFGWDVRYCFTVYQHIEQNEPGDTFTHTFTWPSWQNCNTRYFYFWGTMGAQDSVSDSPIFWLHYLWTPPVYLILRPVGVGDLTEHNQHPDAGEHWQKVDEEAANDGADYVYSSTKVGFGSIDLYTITPHTLPEGTLIEKLILSGQFYIPWSVGFPGAARFYLKTLGVEHHTDFEPFIYDAWYSTPSVDIPLNPESGLPWTLDDLTNLQIGTQMATSFASGPTKNSQLYIEVYIIPPG